MIVNRFLNIFPAGTESEASSGGITAEALQMAEDRFRLGTDIVETGESRAVPPSADFIGLGMSIGIHAVFILSFLMLATFHASRSPFEAPVVFVNLTQISESALAAGGVPHPDTAGGGASPPSGAPKAPDAKTTIPAPVVQKQARVPKARFHKPEFIKRLRKAVSAPWRHVRKPPADKEEAPAAVNRAQAMKPETAPVTDSVAANPSSSPVSASQAETSSVGGGAASGSSRGGDTGSSHGAGEGNGASKGFGGGAGGGSGNGSGGMGGEFGLNQVDQAPVPIRKVSPEFPEAARKLGASGRVLLKFLVKADGCVTQASVVEASPKGLFDHSALEAVCQWRFTPGIYHGHAVATWVMLPVNFRLSR